MISENSCNGIIKYLKKLTDNQFTGFIKISFEDGKPKLLSENNNPENKSPSITQDFDLNKEIVKASKLGFWGTLGFNYDSGKIISYSYTRTRQGSTVMNFFERMAVE